MRQNNSRQHHRKHWRAHTANRSFNPGNTSSVQFEHDPNSSLPSSPPTAPPVNVAFSRHPNINSMAYGPVPHMGAMSYAPFGCNPLPLGVYPTPQPVVFYPQPQPIPVRMLQIPQQIPVPWQPTRLSQMPIYHQYNQIQQGEHNDQRFPRDDRPATSNGESSAESKLEALEKELVKIRSQRDYYQNFYMNISKMAADDSILPETQICSGPGADLEKTSGECEVQPKEDLECSAGNEKSEVFSIESKAFEKEESGPSNGISPKFHEVSNTAPYERESMKNVSHSTKTSATMKNAHEAKRYEPMRRANYADMVSIGMSKRQPRADKSYSEITRGHQKSSSKQCQSTNDVTFTNTSLHSASQYSQNISSSSSRILDDGFQLPKPSKVAKFIKPAPRQLCRDSLDYVPGKRQLDSELKSTLPLDIAIADASHKVSRESESNGEGILSPITLSEPKRTSALRSKSSNASKVLKHQQMKTGESGASKQPVGTQMPMKSKVPIPGNSPNKTKKSTIVVIDSKKGTSTCDSKLDEDLRKMSLKSENDAISKASLVVKRPVSLNVLQDSSKCSDGGLNSKPLSSPLSATETDADFSALNATLSDMTFEKSSKKKKNQKKKRVSRPVRAESPPKPKSLNNASRDADVSPRSSDNNTVNAGVFKKSEPSAGDAELWDLIGSATASRSARAALIPTQSPTSSSGSAPTGRIVSQTGNKVLRKFESIADMNRFFSKFK